jgi:hypothetical protein
VDGLLGQTDQGLCGCLNCVQWLPPVFLGSYLPEVLGMCRVIPTNSVHA